MFGSQPTFVHILTLSFGLIIAYGLLQLVEAFRRRQRKKRETTAAQDAPPPEA